MNNEIKENKSVSRKMSGLMYDLIKIAQKYDTRDLEEQLLAEQAKNEKLVEAIERFKYPCTDCRFYQECNRKDECRTRTNFEFDQVLIQINGGANAK